MKIVPGGLGADRAAAKAVGAVARSETPATPARAASSGAGESALQSVVLRPAIEALEQLPEIDEVRVAVLRDALARGELPFDAGKLAALIQSYHRSA